jgi:hypothetical protein
MAELHGVRVEGEAVPIKGLAFVILRDHQDSERYFEGVLDLVAVQPKAKPGNTRASTGIIRWPNGVM